MASEVKKQTVTTVTTEVHDVDLGVVEYVDQPDQLHRLLGNRQIQLIAIGGSIGTALFVTIGNGLYKGGPGSLLLAYIIYACMMGLVNNCMAEMAVLMPVSGSFVRMAGRWVDEAFGFFAGWNFFLYEAILIPFEISALNLVLSFWRDDIPVAAVCAACVVLYAAINIFAVKFYGEAEFWLANGKIVLVLIVFLFTFITMVGGNPSHDAYGFRYWNKPGAFAEYITTGSTGRFEGFLGSLWSACFTICGPEYVAMVAGEAQHPRKYLKTAFKTMYLRFAIFFIGGALCVGIVIPYNDPTLSAILSGDSRGAGTAAASPYVIAMKNLGVSVLPSITNALLVTSIFSAGNAYTYCGSRTLYSLALQGHAPKFLRKCTKSGVPIYCLGVTMLFSLLSFLTVSSNSGQVITWLTDLVTAAQIIDYIVICVTYLRFYYACRAQGVDRKSLPYYGWAQPYCGYVGLIWMVFIVCTYGYTTFLPGKWNIGTFFTYYTMVLLAPILYFGWKLLKKTKVIRPGEVDLVWDRPIIDAYEAPFIDKNTSLWAEIPAFFHLRRESASESE
ncbi:amino acid permease/ SLC12A domain-containing protein [Lipomyces kononenkoae]|uniref:Amino acid permease/ SLC12A domain-containing protein n=1 Tax=Lipomyces kononenkoae TaxID=34357 RepID=A0ACC3SZ11_LIPKO